MVFVIVMLGAVGVLSFAREVQIGDSLCADDSRLVGQTLDSDECVVGLEIPMQTRECAIGDRQQQRLARATEVDGHLAAPSRTSFDVMPRLMA